MNLLSPKKEQLALYISAFWEDYNCREAAKEARRHPERPSKLSRGSCQEIDPILNNQFDICFPPPILFGLIVPNKIKSGKVGLSLSIFLT